MGGSLRLGSCQREQTIHALVKFEMMSAVAQTIITTRLARDKETFVGQLVLVVLRTFTLSKTNAEDLHQALHCRSINVVVHHAMTTAVVQCLRMQPVQCKVTFVMIWGIVVTLFVINKGINVAAHRQVLIL